MARRLIYVVLALALASLVAGFAVRTTAAPLIASVALSAVVTVAILVGWSRKLRTSGAFDEPEEPAPLMEELLVVEVDEAEITGEVPVKRRRREKVKAAATVVEQKATTTAKPRSRSKPKPKVPAGAKAKPAASARGPRVVVIPGASKYHTKTCRFAKGDDLREVSASVARKRGYTSCGVCKPG